MKRPWLVSLGIALVAALGGVAEASITVVVPDDYPTLQAVMDVQYEDDIDSVFVRPGVVEDSLYGVISGYLTVIGLGDSLTRPRIGPTVVYSSYPLTFANVTFTGRVFTTDAELVLRECRLLAGLSSPINGEPRSIWMDLCRVSGEVFLGYDSFVRIDSCWFDDGRVRADENFLWITNSTFTGAGPGIRSTWEVQGDIRGNTFKVSGIGIQADMNRQWIDENVFEGCAIGIESSADERAITRNVVRNCGVGIVVTGMCDLSENVVLGSQGDGIRYQMTDIAGRVERNVVTRSGGHGIVYERRWSPHDVTSIAHNTSVANAGSGFLVDVASSGYEVVTHNVGYGNGTHGLASIGAADPMLSCNDWFANDSSAVVGMAPGATDLFVDPQFCDVENDDVTLLAGSPLANAPGCGRIGARGVGCEPAGTPLPGTRSTLTLAPVTPNPSAGAVRFRWSMPREEWLEVTVHDVAGRAVAVLARGAFPPGEHSTTWDEPMRSGVYFVRLRGAEGSTTRSFLVRR